MNDYYIVLLLVTAVFGAILIYDFKLIDGIRHKLDSLSRQSCIYERRFVQNDERFASMSQSVVELNKINATLRDAIEAKGDRLTDLEAKFGAAEELISNAAELTEIQASTEKLMRDGLQSIMNYDVYEARKDK